MKFKTRFDSKNKLGHLLSIFLGFILFGCSGSQKPFQQESDLLLDSDYFKVSRFIALESSGEELITKVSKVLVHKNRIIVLDRNSGNVHFFDQEGRFINIIRSLGNGPKELQVFTDMFIDSENDQVHLLSNAERQKLIADLDGNISTKERLTDQYWQEIAFQDGDYFIYQSEIAAENAAVGLSRYDPKTELLEPLTHNIAGKEMANIGMYPNLTNSTEGIGYLVPQTSNNDQFQLVFHDAEKDSSISLYKETVNADQVVIFPFISKHFQSVLIAPGPKAQPNASNKTKVIYIKDGQINNGKFSVNDIYNHSYQMISVSDKGELVGFQNMETLFEEKEGDFYRVEILEANGLIASRDQDAVDKFQKLIKKQGAEGNPIITLFKLTD